MTPVEYFLAAHGARITSPYGMRDDPMNPGNPRMHYGIDFGGVGRGHVWTSPYPGHVHHIGTHGDRGLVVVVAIENTGILQLFQHLDEARCREGDRIEKGYPIGTNGMTGTVTGPHLHYEIRRNTGSNLGTLWGDPAKYSYNGGEIMGKEYTVKNGDSLGRIAQRESISPWSLLVDWNKDRYPGLVRNPDLIQPGMRLRLYDPSQNNLTTLAERMKALEWQLELVQIRLRQVQESWTK